MPDPTMAKMGEQPNAALYVTIQSAYNRNWYLGFGPNLLKKGRVRKGKRKGHTSRFNRGIVYTRDGYKATLPRKMARHKKRHRNPPGPVKTNRCDFRFHTGKYTPRDIQKEWKGLFEHILRQFWWSI